MRRGLALTLIGVAFAVLQPATAEAQAPRTLVVTPSTDLVGGQEVTVSGTGYPPGVQVAYCQGRLSPVPSTTDCGATFLTTTVADDGTFSGQYTVVRYLQIGTTTIDCAQPGAPCGFGSADLAALIITTTPIEFRVQPPGNPDTEMTGRVIDAEGQPVEGARVWAFDPDDTWVGTIQTTTGADGGYVLDDPEPFVQYHVAVGPPPGSDLPLAWYSNLFDGNAVLTRRPFATPVGVTLNAPERALEDVTLRPAGTLQGTVVDPSGDPVAGAVIHAYLGSDEIVGSYGTATAADGTFDLDWILALPPIGTEVRVAIVPPGGSGLMTEWFDDVVSRSQADPLVLQEGSSISLGVITLSSPGAPVLRF